MIWPSEKKMKTDALMDSMALFTELFLKGLIIISFDIYKTLMCIYIYYYIHLHTFT